MGAAAGLDGTLNEDIRTVTVARQGCPLWEQPACPTHPPRCSLPACCPGRWTFGDGEQVIGQFKPPYDESFQVPDPLVAQVLVEHNTTHTYTIPGEGRPPVLLAPTGQALLY